MYDENTRVPPQWPARMPCKIAFVAEAPSDEEIDGMQPLVGPAGRTFNAMLRSGNMDRADYLITNVFDQKAPDNNVQPWLRDEGRMAESAARLNEELSRAKPNLVIPLGGTALFAFTGYSNISTFRGAIHKADRIVPGTKLLPTFHPSAVQRDWRLLPIVVGDFIKATAESKSPAISYPRREILIEPTLQDIADFATECAVSDLLSVDIETGWGQITCIGFAPTQERAMCIPIVDLRKPNKCYWPTADMEFQAWKLIKGICENPAPKLGQNFSYDMLWTLEKKGIAMRNYRKDTRLQHKVMYPELPADLANMSATYTRIGAYKHRGGHYQKQEKQDG